MSISSQSRAKGLERLACSKYNNVLTLGFNTAGNTDYIKKKVQIKVVEIPISYVCIKVVEISISYKIFLKLFFI